MKNLPGRALVLALLMLASSVLAHALVPTRHLASDRPIGQLEQLVPTRFGDWRYDETAAGQLVNPDLEGGLSGLYSQVLSRTYVNSAGYRIMLSIAYGGDQSRDLQIHRPETCYRAQGFRVLSTEKSHLRFGAGIPVMRIETQFSTRTEPVTYWIRIGDRVVRGNVEQGFARLQYGLMGYIADGLLFRVSSLDADSARASRTQEQFVLSVLSAMDFGGRKALLGAEIDPGTSGATR